MPQWSKTVLPATAGLAEQLDPIAAPAEVPLDVLNGRFDRKGAIIKRHGFWEKLPQSTDGTYRMNIRRLWSANDELCLATYRDVFAVTAESNTVLTLTHRGRRAPFGGTITERWRDARCWSQCDAHASPVGPVTFGAASVRWMQDTSYDFGTRLEFQIHGAVYGTDNQVLLERQLLATGSRYIQTAGAGGEGLEVGLDTAPHSVRAWTLNGRCCVGYMLNDKTFGSASQNHGFIKLQDADAAALVNGFAVRQTINDAWHDDINMRTWDCRPYYRDQATDATAYHLAYIINDESAHIGDTVRVYNMSSSHGLMYNVDITRAGYTAVRVAIGSNSSAGTVALAVLWRNGGVGDYLSIYLLTDSGSALTVSNTTHGVDTDGTDDWMFLDNFGWAYIAAATPRWVLTYGHFTRETTPTTHFVCSTKVVTVAADFSSYLGPTKVAYNCIPQTQPWYQYENGTAPTNNDRCFVSLGSLNYDIDPHMKEYLFEARGLYEVVNWEAGGTAAVEYCGRHSVGVDNGLFRSTINSADNLYAAWQPWTIRVGSANSVSRPGASSVGTLERWVWWYGTPIRVETQDNSINSLVFKTLHRMGAATVQHDLNATRTEAYVSRGGTMMGGALPEWYDGATCAEQGFTQPPHIPAVTVDAGHGSAPDGTGVWCAAWVTHDERGLMWRGAPSPEFDLATTAADANYVYTRSNPATIRREPLPHVTVQLYRADTNGIMRRILHPSAQIPNYQYGSLLDGGLNQVAWDDWATTTGAPLYTEGQTYEAAPIEGCDIVHVALERVWMAGAYHRDAVYYSKRFPAITGPIGAEFNEAFSLVVPNGEAVTGLGSIGDRVLVFTKTKVYAVSGQGPADDGSQNDFSQLVCVSPTTGCADPRSVVCTDLGVLFYDGETISMVTPALAVQEVGAGIKESLGAYNTVSCAAWWPEESCVVFGAQDVGRTIGQLFVLDLRWNTWARWTPVDSTPSAVIPEAMAVHNNKLYVADWYGKVHVAGPSQTPPFDGVYGGSRSYVSLDISSGWIQSAGVGGWQLCRLGTVFANYVADHNLNLVVYADYAAASVDTQTYAIASAGGVNETVSIKPAVQKHQAVRFRVYDTDTASPGYGAGYKFAGFVVETAPIGHTAKRAAARR